MRQPWYPFSAKTLTAACRMARRFSGSSPGGDGSGRAGPRFPFRAPGKGVLCRGIAGGRGPCQRKVTARPGKDGRHQRSALACAKNWEKSKTKLYVGLVSPTHSLATNTTAAFQQWQGESQVRLAACWEMCGEVLVFFPPPQTAAD